MSKHKFLFKHSNFYYGVKATGQSWEQHEILTESENAEEPGSIPRPSVVARVPPAAAVHSNDQLGDLHGRSNDITDISHCTVRVEDLRVESSFSEPNQCYDTQRTLENPHCDSTPTLLSAPYYCGTVSRPQHSGPALPEHTCESPWESQCQPLSSGLSSNQTSVIRKSNRVGVIARAPGPQEYISAEQVEVPSRSTEQQVGSEEVKVQSPNRDHADPNDPAATRSSHPNIIILDDRHSSNRFECRVCKKQFQSKNNFKYHNHDDSSTNFPYKCEHCGKGMLASTHYRYHLLTHSGERAHSCPVCSKAFLTAFKLKRHMAVHRSGEKSHGCSQCARKFYSEEELARHTALHTESSSPLPCRKCTQSFTTPAQLKAHMGTHTAPEKLFQCSVCAQRFQRLKHLESHRSLHTGEKPFSCDRCGRSFRTEASHAHHMKTHAEERPFVCETCGRGFVLQKDCLRHQSVHKDNSPFTCPLCDKTFRRIDNRNRHVKIHHMEGKSQQEL